MEGEVTPEAEALACQSKEDSVFRQQMKGSEVIIGYIQYRVLSTW